jgi:hypothetical protein
MMAGLFALTEIGVVTAVWRDPRVQAAFAVSAHAFFTVLAPLKITWSGLSSGWCVGATNATYFGVAPRRAATGSQWPRNSTRIDSVAGPAAVAGTRVLQR